jgi:hypothetical protein
VLGMMDERTRAAISSTCVPLSYALGWLPASTGCLGVLAASERRASHPSTLDQTLNMWVARGCWLVVDFQPLLLWDDVTHQHRGERQPNEWCAAAARLMIYTPLPRHPEPPSWS